MTTSDNYIKEPALFVPPESPAPEPETAGPEILGDPISDLAGPKPELTEAEKIQQAVMAIEAMIPEDKKDEAILFLLKRIKELAPFREAYEVDAAKAVDILSK